MRAGDIVTEVVAGVIVGAPGYFLLIGMWPRLDRPVTLFVAMGASIAGMVFRRAHGSLRLSLDR